MVAFIPSSERLARLETIGRLDQDVTSIVSTVNTERNWTKWKVEGKKKKHKGSVFLFPFRLVLSSLCLLFPPVDLRSDVRGSEGEKREWDHEGIWSSSCLREESAGWVSVIEPERGEEVEEVEEVGGLNGNRRRGLKETVKREHECCNLQEVLDLPNQQCLHL